MEDCQKRIHQVEFLDINDGIVRDADKLWMFSKTDFKADMDRRNISANECARFLNKVIKDKLHTKKAKIIAKKELKNRLTEFP